MFQILVGMLSGFHHWALCWQWVCQTIDFIMLRFVPLYSMLIKVFIMNECWILSNAFSASIGVIVVFYFPFVYVVYCIDYFAYVEPFLWMWDASHLVMVCYLSCVVGFSCCFVEIFLIYVHQRLACDFLLWYLFFSVCAQGDGGFLECLWEPPLLFSLLEEFEKDLCKLFVHLVEFPNEFPVKPQGPGL